MADDGPIPAIGDHVSKDMVLPMGYYGIQRQMAIRQGGQPFILCVALCLDCPAKGS